jgi:hypothetical protein
MTRFPSAEWLDLKALQQYACVSERTLRQWVHRSDNPLPAARVEAKILVRKAVFDRWLESHKVKAVDIGSIVEDLIIGIRGTN